MYVCVLIAVGFADIGFLYLGNVFLESLYRQTEIFVKFFLIAYRVVWCYVP